MFVELLKAIFFGIVEGITEWLPISSTGHLILLDEFIQLQMSDAFKSMFEVVIQLGAILAVVVLYFKRLFPIERTEEGKLRLSRRIIQLWVYVVIAIIPSAVVGLPLDDWMDEHLHTATVVAAMLILYGIAFLIFEATHNHRKPARFRTAEEIDLKTAIIIGCFQALSLIPGTSRSGATILGGILAGCSRAAAAEFSFFMAIPTMLGASLVKLLKFGFQFTGAEMAILLVGCVTAFVVSIVAIRTFIDYIKKKSFSVFGWYRIILGVLVLLYFAVRG